MYNYLGSLHRYFHRHKDEKDGRENMHFFERRYPVNTPNPMIPFSEKGVLPHFDFILTSRVQSSIVLEVSRLRSQ
jgi:hypothetical protein